MKTNGCLNCQFYGKLTDVRLYFPFPRPHWSCPDIAFTCSNPTLMNAVKKRIRFSDFGEEVEESVLIGQVFMNCEIGKP
jgi:hypothetical protein